MLPHIFEMVLVYHQINPNIFIKMTYFEESKRLGQRIAAIRKTVEWSDNGIHRKGMTQKELEARSGVSQSHITRIEQGLYDLRISTLAQIAAGLGKKIDLI